MVERIGRYRVEAELGHSLTGPVYLGLHEPLDRRVVVFAGSGDSVARLRRVGRLLARLDHPSLNRVWDLEEAGDQTLLVVEFIDGRQIEDLAGAGIDLVTALRVTAAIADGLEQLHQLGVVHRAVTADNILLTHDGRAVLTDFSSAAPVGRDELLREGQVTGWPPFMAPEQWTDSASVGPAADLWGLGCTIFTLICGEPPFGAPPEMSQEIADDFKARVTADGPVDLGELEALAPQPVVDVVRHCLAKDPTQRPESVRAVSDALELAAQYVEVTTGEATREVHVDQTILLHVRESRVPSASEFRAISVQERLGAGSHAEVFRAHDVQDDRAIALKVLRRRWSDDPDAVERFHHEARILTRLAHPGIVHLHYYGVYGTRHLLALELLTEGTLEQSARASSPVEAARRTATLLDALAHAHAAGVVHRDLKPANVALRDGRPVIMDFGVSKAFDLARVTMTGAVLGTPAYMAPEQARGEQVGAPADVFAAGVIAYEQLTGRRPVHGEVATLLRQIGHVPAPLLTDFDPELCALVNAMRAFDPADRPTAREAADRLSAWGSGSETWTG